MKFPKLCRKVGAWSERNFGHQGGLDSIAPLMGSAEELLMEFTIAKTKDDQIDALADAIIFLADYCYRADVPGESLDAMDKHLFRSGRTQWSAETNWHAMATTAISISLGSMMQVALKRRQGIRRVSGHGDLRGLALGIGLLGFGLCGANSSIAFREEVMAVWDKVKQRDWVTYPETGFPPSEKEN